MLRSDLHTHTTASDGERSPEDVVGLAARRGLDAVAITDHDTTEGIAEATSVGADVGVMVIPGVEINTDEPDGGHTDVLGYFFDPDHPPLKELLSRIRESRRLRAVAMVGKLQELGAAVQVDDVMRHAGSGSIGRPHVARALVEIGFVDSVGEAFRDFIGRHGPAYAERHKLTPADACRAIRDAGGVPSLAHPVPPRDPRSDPKRLRHFLPPLVEEGLGGLECHYPGYSPKVARWLTALADHFGLIPTGGSDFHGPGRPPDGLGCRQPPLDTVARLKDAARGV